MSLQPVAKRLVDIPLDLHSLRRLRGNHVRAHRQVVQKIATTILCRTLLKVLGHRVIFGQFLVVQIRTCHAQVLQHEAQTGHLALTAAFQGAGGGHLGVLLARRHLVIERLDAVA